MSRCPECGSYSDLKSRYKNTLICPNCKALFRISEPNIKREVTKQELLNHIHYLQEAVLQQGQTISNLMRGIETNRKSIQRLRGKR